MNRRKCLRYIGTGSIIGLSGCLDRFKTDDKDNTKNNLPFNDKRVIEPKHEINIPPRNKTSWNEDYLGKNMDKNTELDFKLLNAKLEDTAIDTDNEGNVFSVRTYGENTDVYKYNNSVDYSDRFVSVIEKGNSFVGDKLEWVRVEKSNDIYILYGYVRRPYQPSNDNILSSVLSIERSQDINGEDLYVSLVVSPSHQVIFDSKEDVITIDQLS